MPERYNWLMGKNEPATKIKLYKVIRIYRIPATSKKQAIKHLHMEDGAENFFETEFAVEDKPKGWFGILMKQVVG